MNFSTIIGVVLTLLGKREEIVSIVQDAIKLFNRVRDMLPREVVDTITADPAPALPAPTEQYSISWIQESLNKLISAGLEVDGEYGPATQEAVKKFQSKSGLVADGWVGVETQAAIVEALKG